MKKQKCKICGKYKPISMFRTPNSRCNECRVDCRGKISDALKQKGIDRQKKLNDMKKQRDEELRLAGLSKTIEEYREHQRNADFLYYKILAAEQKQRKVYMEEYHIDMNIK